MDFLKTILRTIKPMLKGFSIEIDDDRQVVTVHQAGQETELTFSQFIHQVKELLP